jgi:RNA polymerase sigma-70 factor (ECF subfamily)
MLVYLTLIDSEEDRRKFERIYTDYKQTMYYAAFRILKNIHDSEDAVHQAFIRLIDRMDKIDEGDRHKTRGFLVVITEHIAIDIYRKQKRQNCVSYDELEIFTPDDSAHAFDIENTVVEAILKLPVNYSTVLRLKYSQGYSDAEIADILGISEENVRQRISRAKKKLSALLQEEGETV